MKHASQTLSIVALAALVGLPALGCTDDPYPYYPIGETGTEEGDGDGDDDDDPPNDTSGDGDGDGDSDTDGDGDGDTTGDGDGDTTGDGDGDTTGDGDGDGEPLEIVVVTNQDVHPGGGACISAVCPAGMRVLSGGGYWSAIGDPQPIVLDNSRPTNVDEWTVCGYAEQGDTHEWWAQAVCANVDTTIVSTGQVPHPGGGACLEAQCPAGMKVVGGGGYWDALGDFSSRISLDNSRPLSESKWGLCGYSAEANANEWWAQAVCADLDTTIVSTEQVPHPGGGACLKAACPEGMSVVGGGGYWDSLGDANIRLDNNRPTDGNEWGLCGYTAEADSYTWFTQAICI